MQPYLHNHIFVISDFLVHLDFSNKRGPILFLGGTQNFLVIKGGGQTSMIKVCLIIALCFIAFTSYLNEHIVEFLKQNYLHFKYINSLNLVY